MRAISRYSGFQGRDRRFVWLSDGLENSGNRRLRHEARRDAGLASFAKRADYDLIRPDALTGMDVTVLLVESLTLPQPGLEFVTHDELRRWWPAFFEANGAARVRLERLRPVNGSWWPFIPDTGRLPPPGPTPHDFIE
ncbi:MAG: hypothetical protein H6844_19310 [Alphaproteobacteria bacterium]|nr:hypothetical protein [Alphaproteobacteria bacterium]